MILVIRKLIILCFVSSLGLTAGVFQPSGSNVFFKPQNPAECCYNNTKQEAGSVIEEFQEVCLQLVCAVKQNEFSSRAVILPVAIPNSLCTGTPCEDCYDTNCVDEAGLIHAPGSSWMLSNCSRCGCDAQNLVHCMPLPAICLPPPDPSCVEILGPCCSTWECLIVNNCVDSEGEIREINEVWGGPCITFLCTSGGIVTRIEDCAPLPLNASCHVFTPEGQCCPEVKCGCVDGEGEIREINEEWGGPCITFICTSRGIVVRIEDCGPLPLNDSCHAFTPEGQCCPELKCGCVDSEGEIREINEKWGDPCKIFICTSEGIVTLIVDCAAPLPLNASCRAFTPKGQCCPELRCGCLDSEGVIREVNEEWGGPCITFLCTSQGIVVRIEDCSPLPLNASCHAFTLEGQCCPELRCGCVDSEGEIREINEAWGGPCISFLCTSEGIVTRIEDCAPLSLNGSCHAFTPEGRCCPELRCGICIDSEGELRELNEEWGGLCHFSTCTENGTVTHAVDCPPLPEVNETCQPITLEGECCPQLRCGCVDEGGDFHKLDSEWHPDPCTYYRCSAEGILKATRLCSLGPKPHSSCKEVTKDNECCPEWDCERKPSYGCVDENGEYHKLGVTWYYDSCTESTCTAEGIVHKKEECEIQERPHFNCEQFVPQGKCCQEWKCGEDCSVVLCEGPPVNSTCEVIHVKLSCCSTYNCSQCMDGGKVYLLNEKWKNGPCVTKKCTTTGIKSKVEFCHQTEAPNPTCQLVVLDGDCCPQWNCTCLDENGKRQQVGSRWTRDCVSYECTDTGIINSYIPCVLKEPEHFNCIPFVPVGECCPIWNCGINCALVRCGGPPNEKCVADVLPPLACCPTYTCPPDSDSTCVDAVGAVHEIGSVWKHNCRTYNCTNDGVKIQETSCYLSPAPHDNCKMVLYENSCCLEWECGAYSEIFPEEADLVIPIHL